MKAPTIAKDDAAVCSFCNRRFSLSRTQCPHCAQPQPFPNVRLAEQEVEHRKLRDRYEQAWKDSRRRGLEKIVAEFESVCGASLAVCNCSVTKLFREIATGNDIFECYHDLERLRVRSERPVGYGFQRLRPQAENELMGSEQHLDKLHYAALSLDGSGLDSDGDCTITLRSLFIAPFSSNSSAIVLCIAKTSWRCSSVETDDSIAFCKVGRADG